MFKEDRGPPLQQQLCCCLLPGCQSMAQCSLAVIIFCLEVRFMIQQEVYNLIKTLLCCNMQHSLAVAIFGLKVGSMIQQEAHNLIKTLLDCKMQHSSTSSAAIT